MTQNLRKPDPQAIAALAYELYLERGAVDGDDLKDWLDAERQLEAISNTSARPAPIAAKSNKRDVAAA